MREHLAVSSRLLIAQETGDLADVDKFELNWIDLLTLQRSQLGEQPSDAEASDLSSAQAGESDKENESDEGEGPGGKSKKKDTKVRICSTFPLPS